MGKDRGDRYTVTVSGGVTGGQVAVGRDIRQVNEVGRTAGADPVDVAAVRELIAELKRAVAAEAPPEQVAAALGRVDELAEAVTAGQPDVSTVASVRNWFARHLPALGAKVYALILSPVVAKVVGAAGDVAAAEFQRYFGA